MVERNRKTSPLQFAKPSSEKTQPPPSRTWKVLIVDDDVDMVAVTRLVFDSIHFEGMPIEVLPAYSSNQAIEILSNHDDIAMAFIDVVMETDRAGLDLVRYIRDDLNNNEIQLVLRTGQPGYAPEVSVILEYGINDYRLKTDLDSIKLTTALVSALRNYENIRLAKQAARNNAILDEVNRTKSLFFAQMSHDLRTPLNSIMGFCDLLSANFTGVEQQEQLHLIKQSSEHLLAIVNDILDLSKAEAGKVRLNQVPLVLAELLLTSKKLIEPLLSTHVEFRIEGLEHLPPLVMGDPLRIKQILQNLLSNAVKFTTHGSIVLKVGAEQTDRGDWRVNLTLSDTGVGIPPARMSQLFNAYEQVGARIARPQGTGLGLTICKLLVDLMDGDISLTSEPNRGTTFHVHIQLPAVPEGVAFPEQGDVAPNIANLSPDSASSSTLSRRVLVVDDDATNRLVVRKMLEYLNCLVDCAPDGAIALSMVSAHEYDLIFMDCNMPHMDGIECVRRLRQLDSVARVPVIALTGADDTESREACSAAGMNGFLHKPVEMKRLLEIVEKWFGGRGGKDIRS
ncbi:sensory box histidine kinase/response regulator [Oleiphilus messinensis]|uniref:histidine kinase n=1 Tax=Oleiphilus messinensis TaxID=141451 RepID=A0A1Y0IA86_9GAMM|nr:response regulator [Oleiphilus messinensis]ARU56385.1 sensory box histidine kinase/response regulator [Oleiphilus messinensis]